MKKTTSAMIVMCGLVSVMGVNAQDASGSTTSFAPLETQAAPRALPVEDVQQGIPGNSNGEVRSIRERAGGTPFTDEREALKERREDRQDLMEEQRETRESMKEDREEARDELREEVKSGEIEKEEAKAEMEAVKAEQAEAKAKMAEERKNSNNAVIEKRKELVESRAAKLEKFSPELATQMRTVYNDVFDQIQLAYNKRDELKSSVQAGDMSREEAMEEMKAFQITLKADIKTKIAGFMEGVKAFKAELKAKKSAEREASNDENLES